MIRIILYMIPVYKNIRVNKYIVWKERGMYIHIYMCVCVCVCLNKNKRAFLNEQNVKLFVVIFRCRDRCQILFHYRMALNVFRVSDFTSCHRFMSLQQAALSPADHYQLSSSRRRRCAAEGTSSVQGDLLDNVMGRISDHKVQKNAERHANKRRFTAVGGAMRACESLAAQWEEPSCGAELITHWAEVRDWFHKIIVRYLLVRRCLFSSCVCLL